jgi:hypothetical protein
MVRINALNMEGTLTSSLAGTRVNNMVSEALGSTLSSCPI